MGVPLAAIRGWLFGLVAFASPGGKMLRADPVSTRKYLWELESKTWRSALPADKLFIVDRLARFPAPKRCETCRAGDSFSPDHQTLSGICIYPVVVAMFGLTWF